MFLENEKRKKKSDPKSLLFTHYPLQPQCSQNWLIITCFSYSEFFHYLELLGKWNPMKFFFLIHTSRPLWIVTGQSNNAKNNCGEDTCLSLLIFTRNKKEVISKGQIISRAIFVFLTSSKKRTKKIWLVIS